MLCGIEVEEVHFPDVPIGAVRAQGFAGDGTFVEEEDRVEASLLQAKCEATPARTDFE